ncbi:MAG TPA: ATP-binding protein [Thermoanaerobaculia bacterium]|nr:ATP-binding protein [Thermoanaerobaculia bacterium]
MHPLAHALLHTTADPAWVVDRSFAATQFNAPFAKMVEKLVKTAPVAPVGLDALVEDGEANAWWRDVYTRVFDGGSVMAERRPVIDGVKRYYLISGTPVVCENEIAQAVFMARDVTDVTRGDPEDLLELAVTRILTAGKSLEDVLTDVLAFVCESDGWDFAVIRLVQPETRQLATVAAWSRPGIPENAATNAITVPLLDAQRVIGALELMASSARPLSHQRQHALERAGKTLGRLIVHRQMQTIIEKKNYEWTQTFDAIALPVFITRMDGTITRVNRAARDLVGGTFQDVLGRNIAVSEDEPWKTLADTVAAVRDSRTPCTAQIAQQDRHWDVNAAWYESTADGEDRVIIVMRDTTDLVRLSESVRRGEQLAALGELVGGVAHEVRNPIFGIGITIDTMQQLLPDNPDFNELADVLRGWLGRLNRLMENLLAYGKSWTLNLEEGSLEAVLRATVDGCRQIAAQSSIEVDADIEPELLMLMDPHRLGHAFENLIVNAIQHSSLRQRVHVSARRAPDGLTCEVRDHGPGFNPAELPRIFEPFFTKRRGGTGLGLSIVQRVVDEHGGTIAAGNAPDGGAVVTVRFPVFTS